MVRLPVRRQKREFPAKEAILAAMKVANSVPGAEYLEQRFQKTVEESNISKESAKSWIAAIRDFVINVQHKFSLDCQPWSGQLPKPSGIERMQAGLAEQAFENLEQKGIPKEIMLYYAVSEKGKIEYGYAPGKGQPMLLDDSVNKSLDRAFNAWLSEQQILNENGMLYHAQKDASGELAKGKQLATQEVEQLIADSTENSYGNYLNKQGSYKLSSEQIEYSGEKRLEQQKSTMENEMEADQSFSRG